MRPHTIVSFFLALFLTSCANEGVIVRKDSGPLPFYESLGVDGSYAFLLRDSAGSTRRQLVTPEVFERYAVGQYFNDLQPVATQPAHSSEFKQERMASIPAAQNNRRVASAGKPHRTASVKKATHARRTAAKAHKSKKSQKSQKAIAKRTPVRGKKKILHTTQALPAKSIAKRQVLLVTVDRCR